MNLSTEKDIEKWILGKPEVNCRIDDKGMNSSQKLLADSFRWEVFYTRKELQKILTEKTGEDLGIIYEIIPLNRGVSGRIKEIEILGSLKNIKIAGELNIRSAFSETFLNSSCFIIQTEPDLDGIPMSFLFVGAGKGHGVGLCKVGAVKMATENAGHEEILRHYHEKCEIKRIY
jgi:SpoIID/LytB domain protein